jgi:HPt (histidine-containing phosphotransfer) domain-containing protein
MPDLAESPVLDIYQLRSICMEDVGLMRELAGTLVDDASSQIPALMDAVEHADSTRCARLAHYVKGACANVGAVALAALMKSVERSAIAGDFAACRAALGNLNTELQKFSAKTASL